MANHLRMARVHVIQALGQRGWSFRRIARELGVHRDTAARYLRLAKMNLAIRCVDANPGPQQADSFHNGLHKDLKADFVTADGSLPSN